MKNYIGNNNEINKKKYKHSLPPKLNPNAGNVEYNISMFNKMNDVNMPSNVAADVSGMSEDYKTRERIISELRSLGKNYKFEKYSDAQLYAMLNRVLNQPKSKFQRKDTIDIKRDKRFSNGIVNDDPSYNFDDPDRIGDYKVKESIKESLNKIDHYCIDNDLPFYDLRSLYEATQPMTPEKKRQLKKLLDDPNVTADTVKGFIQGADPNRKMEELNESEDHLTYDELIELAHEHFKEGGMEIIEFWDENSLNEYEKEFGPLTKENAIRLMKVMGNVSNEEKAASEYFSKQTYEDSGNYENPLTKVEIEDIANQISSARSEQEVLAIIDQYDDQDYAVWRILDKIVQNMWSPRNNSDYNTKIISEYILQHIDDISSHTFTEDTVKQGNKWVNKGDEGTHGKFNTKKEADAQRRAIWVNWNKYKAESLNEHILSENDLREAAKEYYDQVKKDIELINKYPDILTDKYNSKESLISGLENDVIEPFELYDWIIATLNENNILTEDYTKADDEWGDPYTYEEVYDNLKSLTNDFSDKDGNVRCQYEQEKIYGVDILKKYYKVVETSDARMTDGEAMSWVISYSGLKK